MKKEKKDQIIRRISEQSILKLTPMHLGGADWIFILGNDHLFRNRWGTNSFRNWRITSLIFLTSGFCKPSYDTYFTE